MAVEAAPTAEEITAAGDRVWGSGRFQTDLPQPAAPAPPRTPPPPVGPITLGPVLQIILIAVLVGAALLALSTLLNQNYRKRETLRASEAPPAPPSEEPDAGFDAAALADAEQAALAAAKAGRHAEAIRLLLHGAIGRLREQNARAAGRSLTSREILAKAFPAGRLQPEASAARDALAALVRAVEVSFFGGRPPDAAAFDRALAAYRALRAAVAAVGSSARAGRAGARETPAEAPA